MTLSFVENKNYEEATKSEVRQISDMLTKEYNAEKFFEVSDTTQDLPHYNTKLAKASLAVSPGKKLNTL